MTRSASSVTKEYLAAQPVGYTFTVTSLLPLLRHAAPGITAGAVSGFCSRAGLKGFLKGERRTDGVRDITYELIKPIDGMPVHEVAGQGSVVGRGDGAHQHRAPRVATRDQLRDRLLEIATMVEGMRLDITEVATKDLLAELLRRERNGNNGAEQ